MQRLNPLSMENQIVPEPNLRRKHVGERKRAPWRMAMDGFDGGRVEGRKPVLSTCI